MGYVQDLIGQRFGRLTVIKGLENNKHGQSRWLCKCDCGNEHIATQGTLKYGKIKSCGCLHKENSKKWGTINGKKFKDLTGKKFGELVAIKKEKNNGKNTMWLCECECGNEKIVSSKHLLNGGVKSCGHLVSKAARVNQVKAVSSDRYMGTKIGQLKQVLSKNNSSGHKGIRWHKGAKKWMSRITFQGKEIYLGIYEKLEDAIKARKEAEEKYFKPIIEEYKKAIKDTDQSSPR